MTEEDNSTSVGVLEAESYAGTLGRAELTHNEVNAVGRIFCHECVALGMELRHAVVSAAAVRTNANSPHRHAATQLDRRGNLDSGTQGAPPPS